MGFHTLVSGFRAKLVITILLLKNEMHKAILLSFFFETGNLVKDYQFEIIFVVFFFFLRINIAERTIKIIFLPTR